MKYSSIKKSKISCILGKFSRIHYINFALTLTLVFSSSIAFGAEGISVPLEKTPVITGKTGAASDVSKTYIPKEQTLQKTGEEAQKMTTKEGQNAEKEQSPFVKGLFNMFKALFGVLAIICGLSGAVLFYKWLKSKSVLVKVQQQAAQAALETKEPATVSEAVASFVKHRIKK
ncbi:MAG: hypothetical protein PHC34_09215 [Candidatus Gastranaerophilales bacterium]|nr:hypothetical protein [Candidatus Gastranaerophilales bacterium]